MTTKTEPERAQTQPNAGWGVLCESCTNRDRSDLEHDDFPCTRVHLYFRTPRYKRVNILAPDLTRYREGERTWEDCSDYRPDSELPDLSRTAKAIEQYDALEPALMEKITHGSAKAAEKALELLEQAGREVGRAFGQDTADRNDPKVCEECIRPGGKTPAPGERDVSFVRRMVRLWRERETRKETKPAQGDATPGPQVT